MTTIPENLKRHETVNEKQSKRMRITEREHEEEEEQVEKEQDEKGEEVEEGYRGGVERGRAILLAGHTG